MKVLYVDFKAKKLIRVESDPTSGDSEAPMPEQLDADEIIRALEATRHPFSGGLLI